MVRHVQPMNVNLDEVFESGFRYFSVVVISKANFPTSFDIVKRGMKIGYHSLTVAVAVW
jgi:hypothetical protein